MSKVLDCLSALTLVSTLAACGSPDKPTNEVVANDTNAIMAKTGPFGDAEVRMNGAMTAAVGVNAADNWVREMIEHHRGAVNVSRIVLAPTYFAILG